jgi:hypothetical protein
MPGSHTVCDSAIIGRFKVAIGGKGVADPRVFRLGELFVDGVVEALYMRLAMLPSNTLRIPSTYGSGHSRVRLAIPGANEIRRCGCSLGLRVVQHRDS